MNSNLKPFTFFGYDQKKKWEVRNDGHSGGSHVGWTGRPNCAVLVNCSGLEVGGATELLERRLHQLGVFSVISSE